MMSDHCKICFALQLVQEYKEKLRLFTKNAEFVREMNATYNADKSEGEVSLQSYRPDNASYPSVRGAVLLAPHGMHCAGGQVLQHDAFLNYDAAFAESAGRQYFILFYPSVKLSLA